MKQTDLRELYIDELRDLYSAETQLVEALPKMAEAATSDQLRQGFEDHLEKTKDHVERLDQIFESLKESPKGKKCKGMEGLINEGQEMIENGDFDGEVLDAGLISAAQRVEHYEIAGYGCVRTYAGLLGQDEAVSLLEQTLKEEKETDEKLTELAEDINVEAMGAADQADRGAEPQKASGRQTRRRKRKAAGA